MPATATDTDTDTDTDTGRHRADGNARPDADTEQPGGSGGMAHGTRGPKAPDYPRAPFPEQEQEQDLPAASGAWPPDPTMAKRRGAGRDGTGRRE